MAPRPLSKRTPLLDNISLAKDDPQPIEPVLTGFQKVFTSIDGERIARRLPQFAILLGGCVLVGWFLWLQSVDLYAASGFAKPGLVAFGGILMVVGFACFHAANRSKLALLCCIYAGGYEAYFITSGTIANERSQKFTTKAVTDKLSWHEEQLARAKVSYDRLNERYTAPTDKMHQNSWYKRKHVEPAWAKYSNTQKEMESQRFLHSITLVG